MKILVIGNLGYVGPGVVAHFKQKPGAAYVAGYDIGYFVGNYTSDKLPADILLDKQYYGDVRNFNFDILNGFDQVVYLAAISNDPMGNVYEVPTIEINATAAHTIAAEGKKRGISSFVFASSCSVYGFADENPRNESSEVNPLTAYAKSKVMAEELLKPLADDNFKVTCLRFATACGFSDRLRLDLVLNDFVASALVNKEITILSDGTPWRPLIHVKDMARAIDWALQRNEGNAFLIINTGSNIWNYQVKELAYAVKDVFGDVAVSINENAQPDKRSYKVDFKLFEELAGPEFQPQIGLTDAVKGLKSGLEAINFHDTDFRQSGLIRLKSIQGLINKGIIDENLLMK